MSPLQLPNRGFTLLELIFSMTIGSMILILAASILSRSSDSYEHLSSSVVSDREARAAITQLTADLSSAHFHPDDIMEPSTKRWPVDHLGFLCLQPAQAQNDSNCIGDLCAVNYYIKDLIIGEKNVRCLMRGFHDSKLTFQALHDGTIASLFIEQPNLDEPVALGVVSFEARPRSRDTSGKWTSWSFDPLQPTTGPAALEIKLVIARRDLASKLKLAQNWEGYDREGQMLGDPAIPQRHKNLEVYSTLLGFGTHAN